jgi:hypothetical protein
MAKKPAPKKATPVRVTAALKCAGAEAGGGRRKRRIPLDELIYEKRRAQLRQRAKHPAYLREVRRRTALAAGAAFFRVRILTVGSGSS